MSEDMRGYVGVKPCGCWVNWCSSKVPAKDLAKTVAAWARSGLSIERCTTEEARERLSECACKTFVSTADYAIR